jgi:hypothetical protein
MPDLQNNNETQGLKRSLYLSMLVFYGAGTIQGLCIYVLRGKIVCYCISTGL